MPVEVIMPKVDMDMTSGRIVTWHAAAGDSVEKGAPLFDIETDKAAMEVEAPADGILHHPVDTGVDIPIGQPVAWLYTKDEDVSNGGDAPRRELGAEAEPAPEPSASPDMVTDRAVDGAKTQGIRATPLARSLAREAGIELDGVDGSGLRGRVQADDVRALLDACPQPAPAAVVSETGRLAVTRSGGEVGTPVLLLHGFVSDSASWSPLERHLGDSPILRIDLPAHGRSPHLDITDFADLAATVRKTFDGLDADRMHLVGHSLGGALALALADTRARHIDSLTLIAPAGLGPEIDGPTLDGIGRATRPESLGPWLRKLVADEALVTDRYVRAVMATRKEPGLRAAQQALSDALFPDGVQAFDLRTALGRLEMPARILWGRQDGIIPWRHALAAPGRVALHLLDGVGHLPQIEAPDEVGKIIGGSL